MKTLRFSSLILAASCLYCADLPQLTDSLSTIDTSKWSQTGTLSTSSQGVSGNGVLLAKTLSPAVDYDSRMTVHTAEDGVCKGTYSLFARSTPDNSSAYALTVANGSAGLFKVVAGSWTVLSWMPYSCTEGTALRLVVRGSDITTWSGPNRATYHDPAPLQGGLPGIGISSSNSVGGVEISAVKGVAPQGPQAARIESSVTPRQVLLRWPAAAPEAVGSGLAEYAIYRDGVYVGSTQTPDWIDDTVSPASSFAYSILAVDQHGNASPPATVNIVTPAGIGTSRAGLTPQLGKVQAHVAWNPQNDQRRVGVRPTGAYWGGAGEQIDTLSGNLNFTVPLIKALGRGGWGVDFVLSYNSQMWRKDSSGAVWLLGQDVGYGVGWKLQAGSIQPIWSGSTLSGYRFTDSTGAEYMLDQLNGTVWSSVEGIYLYYDSATNLLHFTDGSFWSMNVQSASGEQDAGTLYPSLMEDPNGNTIEITYATGIWGSGQSSARITGINDARCQAYSPGCYRPQANFVFTYSTSGIPHLTSIINQLHTSESYWFSMNSGVLYEPFNHGGFSTLVSTLQSVTVNGLGISHQFVYGNSTGELTQVTTPLGGKLEWDYATFAYSSRSYREVYTRYLTASPGATRYQYNVRTDSNTAWHASTHIDDVGAGTSKYWYFSTATNYTAGLLTQYEEHEKITSAVLLEKDFTWAQTGAASPYVGTLVSKLNPGQSYAAQTKSVQTLDNYGNLTQSQLYDYPSGTSLTRTYNVLYLHNYWYGAPYVSRYILNRPTSATLTPAGGSAITLFTKQYDGGVSSSSAGNNHDPTYDTSYLYRGNVGQSNGLNGGDITYFGYDAAGVLISTQNAVGTHVDRAPSADSAYSLPGTLTPNGNTSLQTTASYATSFAVASMMGPNSATSNTSYDTYGRPTQSQIPDGATTTYAYTYSPPTQTATVNGRWQKTTLDGFGRAIRVDTGNGTTTVSTVYTEYAPCACSPMLKLYRTSLPTAGGGAPSWTTYTYDGSGRTLTVTQSGSGTTGTTTYTYQGNTTTVQDPAGKIKKSTVDAFGNLTQVTEDPSGLNYVTYYTYNALNQLTGTSMTRGAVTQTRTFSFNGRDMVSATNPENGTVTYAYDAVHRVTSRVDAKGQETQYDYDSYGRQTQVRHYPTSGTEDLTQRASYYYDGNDPCGSTTPTNGAGRLTAVSYSLGSNLSLQNNGIFDNYCYSYGYSGPGRITSEQMKVGSGNANWSGVGRLTMASSYQWDNEGRMTSQQYPTVWLPQNTGPTTLQTAGYQYDANGRMNTMTWDAGYGPTTFATATYGTSGEMLSLSYGAGTEYRTYNSLLQLTNQSLSGYMNMTYNYPATGNNGRIAGSVDAVAGETTTYSYDGVSRLTGASNSLWSATYGYDGFGNLTSKSGTGGAPSMTAAFDAGSHQVGSSYDANGNQLYGVNASNSYNVENRLTGQASATWPVALTGYVYDPSGKRVAKRYDADPYGAGSGSAPVWEFYYYGITGQKLVTVSCPLDLTTMYPMAPNCTIVGENVYFGRKQLVSNGLTVATDRLGSVRGNSNGEKFSYYPYGEERTSTVDGRDKFGTYSRDSAGQDYADQRYYGSGTGRFWSADPYMNSAGAGSSASWNRYGYTRGDPMNRIDPSGLADITVEVNEDADQIDDGSRQRAKPALPTTLGDLQGAPKTTAGGMASGGQSTTPLLPYGNNYSSVQISALQNGLNDAIRRTFTPECGGFFAEVGPAGALTGESVLENTMYRLLPLTEGAGATPQDSYNVIINSNGAFFNAAEKPNGTVSVQMPDSTGAPISFTFVNTAALRGFLLLHELGHQMGLFLHDGDDLAANGKNSQAVLDRCFKTEGGIIH